MDQLLARLHQFLVVCISCAALLLGHLDVLTNWFIVLEV